MAYWERRGKARSVYVYTRYKDGLYNKDPVRLPRSMLKHLDVLDDVQVNQWVREYEHRWEQNTKFQPDQILLSDELLSSYLEKYKLHLLKYRSESTALNRVSIVRRYAFPFFLSQNPPLKDPQLWIGVSIRLLEHLEKQDLSWSLIRAVNTDLRGFYKYLIEEGIVQHGRELPLRFPKKSEEDKATPLPFVITPDNMLAFIRRQSDERVKLMGLLGYFFSMRPQETFGVRRSDFVTKPDAIRALDCIRYMTKAELFDKFAIHVDRQRTNKGKLVDPKSGSRGHVACFNEEAARLTIELLKKHKPTEAAFDRPNRYLYDLWSEAKLGLTLKDLRRSSLRYLGMETLLGETPLHLKEHARHSDFNTTLLYLRAPKQASDDNVVDDLDISNW